VLQKLHTTIVASSQSRSQPVCWVDSSGSKACSDTDKLPLLIFVNKGIEEQTQALTLEIIADTFGAEMAKVSAFIVSFVLPAGLKDIN
jgi:hypothetical protein